MPLPLHLYHFRPVMEGDLDVLGRWRGASHVRKWWGDPEIEPEGEKLSDSRISMWMVEWEGSPFAFLQDYTVHGWDEHPFAHLPQGARGIDLYIGEVAMLGQGHGPALLRAWVERLFSEGVPAVGIDPHPENAIAIRSFEKAGFRIVGGPVTTRWGRALLMEAWPDKG